MANSNRRNTIVFARNIVPVFFAVVILLMIINIIIMVITLIILFKSRSSMCDTSHVGERDEQGVEQYQEDIDETTYNITSNKYSYAFCNQKHCIQIGNAIYFAGEFTPYGKLLTATPTRLICEVSPTEYNVVYRIY